MPVDIRYCLENTNVLLLTLMINLFLKNVFLKQMFLVFLAEKRVY